MIQIILDGFYRDPKSLPAKSGIYVVFACRYNQSTDSIFSARVIYIGMAENIRDRHFNGSNYCHEHLKDFHDECRPGESVWYCYALIDGSSLLKVENALIAMQQPPINTNGKESYNHTADYFKIYGDGANDFTMREFGFSKDYDINSLYTEGDIEF